MAKAQLTQDRDEVLSSLLIPIQDKMLLLPNVSVAEIIGFQQPSSSSDTPEWHLGQINWREQSIPVISFEVANGEEYRGTSRNARVAIINSISGNRELAFFAIVVQGIPHSVRLTESDVIAQDEPNQGELEAMHVLAHGEPAIIPKLDSLETMILAYGLA
ncbi:chemotaxis protein CheW [Zooshikella sp. RANM57]|uniref:chemotaxis protein CheW n=1 Tax=Zooshikella sp. RANM57 TaxID=3425863 RepID=UPI003D6EBBE4